MSTAIEAAWIDVIASLEAKPRTIAALVSALDKRGALDHLKQQVLADAATELRADLQAPTKPHAAVWLRDQLQAGERRSQELKGAAAQAGIAWRRLEGAKREAGAIAVKHDNASWWQLNSATPSLPAARSATLNPVTSRAPTP